MSAQSIYGTGRRKTSTARVYLRSGSGNITVNKKPLDDFFGRKTARMIVRQPLEVVNMNDKFDVEVKVIGGGTTQSSPFLVEGSTDVQILSPWRCGP